MFIDEFPVACKFSLKIIRNVARALHLPCIVASTNARIKNLLGISLETRSRGQDSLYPWVKVVFKLPHANGKIVSSVIKVPIASSTTSNETISRSINLDEFVSVSSKKIIKATELFSLIGFTDLRANEISNLKNLFDFILSQSTTSLPGLSILALKILLDILSNMRASTSIIFSIEFVWEKLLREIFKKIRRLKKCFKPDSNPWLGIYASCSIFTFRTFKKYCRSGEIATQNVERHLFYYGEPASSQITVALETDESSELYLNRISWIDQCYFPRFDCDFFANLAALGSFTDENGRHFGIAHDLQRSIADVFYRFLGVFHAGDNIAGRNDSVLQEQLTYFCIANASHQSFNGKTNGLVALKEFAIQLQVYERAPVQVSISRNNFDDEEISFELEKFLSRVELPYFSPIPSDHLNASFRNQIKNFMKIGHLERLLVGKTFDIRFDFLIDNIKNNGYIECKFTDKPTGLATILKYVEKSIEWKCPLTFIVVHKLANQLKKPLDEFNETDALEEIDLEESDDKKKLRDKELEAKLKSTEVEIEENQEEKSIEIEITPREETKKSISSKKSKFSPLTPIERYINLINSKDINGNEFRINLYSFSVDSEINEPPVLKGHVLREVPDPQGIFVIIQTNFRTSKR